MFQRVCEWQYWERVRAGAAFFAALATVLTLGFGVLTYYQQAKALNLVREQDSVVFRIVSESGESGAPFATIKTRYVERATADIPADDAVQDADLRLTLLRLTPQLVLVKDRWYVASSAPLSDLRVFVEDIAFGIPSIPDVYTERSVTEDEVADLLMPIRNAEEIIMLQADEVQRLNRLTEMSNQALRWRVTGDRSYTTNDVVDHFENAFRYYYDYTQWEKVTKRWSEFLATSAESEPLVPRVQSFVKTEVTGLPSNPNLLRALTGMAVARYLDEENYLLDTSFVDGDCDKSEPTNIRFHEHPDEPGSYVLNWGRSMSSIGSIHDFAERKAATATLAVFFQHACAETLSRVFADASEIFGREHKYMKESLDEWNRIFNERKPASLNVAVTITNAGRFDTYIRRQIQASVGALDAEAGTQLTLTSSDNSDEDAVLSPFLRVGTRAPSTYRFRASLEEPQRDSLYEAFGEVEVDNFIEVKVIESFRESNNVTVSPPTPFSTAARNRSSGNLPGRN